ncbi:membrane protein [Ligilactobacillus salitolerans]|uniref:Membrane protein n=1 Tax=Ligilactobacillus salitolerans TaxID=1808352 RepID=A0A401IT20_9LACO|nr:TIGR01906 family membrane protein [Ligilactobacillus salitolerans]GBG94671.1 membrane protein [Ligilactobacillus salitolerans]
MPKTLRFQALYQVVLFLTVLAFCIAFVINFQPLYYYFADHQHLAQSVSLTKEGLRSNYQHLLNYLNFPWIKELQLTLPSSPSGLQHFADVKKLFLLDYAVLLCGMPISIWYLRKLVKQGLLWTLIVPAQIILAGTAVLAVMMTLSFQQFFVYFHKLLFRNNDWLFDPLKDPIINALPDEFFFACFGLFFVLFVGGLLGMIWIGKRSLKK